MKLSKISFSGLIIVLTVFFTLISGCIKNQVVSSGQDGITDVQSSDVLTSDEATSTIAESPDDDNTFPDSVITTAAEGENNPLEFDFDEALNNIYLLGNKISFPETVGDLGEEFTLSKEGLPFRDKNEIGFTLYHEGVSVAGITLEISDDGKYGVESKVKVIAFGLVKNCKGSGIYKFRIGMENDADDIRAFFGKQTPTKYNPDVSLEYIDDSGRVISISVPKGKVFQIIIRKYE